MDLAPSQLGRYRIEAELGRGAMGVVYRAADPLLDRTVALKAIRLSAAGEEREQHLARFFQEAKAAGRLAHPGIITIYDVGREGDLAYMAMELLQGQDLRQRLQQGRPPLRQAVEFARQLAEALAFAHEQGVVHRDIKPANIMVLRGERVKLMDFGIARTCVSDVMTQTGVLMGTPKYMSPEQVAGKRVGPPSDLFSLGVVLYELLTGWPPFSGADTPELMFNVANAAVPPPSRIQPALPGVFDLIVAKALAKSPDERYASAQEFAADLRAGLQELEAAGPVPDADGTAALDGTRTLAISVESGDGRDTRGDTGLRLPLALRFDSTAACRRLAAPSAADQTLFTRAPQRPHPLARLWRDPAQRLLLALLTGGAALGLLVAFL